MSLYDYGLGTLAQYELTADRSARTRGALLIDFLFLGLTLTSFGIMEHATHMLAAYSELAIAIVSFYGCGAAVLNTHFGKVFLPVGKPFGIFKK